MISVAVLVAALLACALTGLKPLAGAASSLPFTLIDAPGAGVYGNSYGTSAAGINDAGQIVGDYIDSRGKDHGFLRTATGAFTVIDVPGATRTYAAGINNAGQIVGGLYGRAR